MQTLAEIKDLLASRGLRPKRSLGQNFLIDHNLIRKLVDASGVGPGSLVLEAGPGTGTMTEELLARGCRVVACELDDGLAGMLAERMPTLTGGEHFRLIHRDCLEGKHALAPEIVEALGGEPFSLVANLPYGAATPLLSTLLLRHPTCHTMAVTIQREVADRLSAPPGCKEYGPLSVIARVFAEFHRVAQAPPSCFWPRPDVTSSLVLLRRRPNPPSRDAEGLSAFLAELFAHRRKQLGSVLGAEGRNLTLNPPASEDDLRDGKFDLTARAEQLSVDQILSLGRRLGRITS